MITPNTTQQHFTFTENMTVTFVLDWGVIQVPVFAPDVDDFDYIVNAAQFLVTFLVTEELACASNEINANEVYLTNSNDETVEV